MGLRPSASSLDGVDVVDMGTGFSGALAARLLADLGASVTRVRESGEDDPFAASSAAYRLWRAQQPTVECRTAGRLMSGSPPPTSFSRGAMTIPPCRTGMALPRRRRHAIRGWWS